MALLIERPISVMGIELSQIYMRFSYVVNLSGTAVIVDAVNYASKEAYEADVRNNILIPEIKGNQSFSYVRETDGDILQFIHNKYKEILTTDNVAYTRVKDPSTGELIHQEYISAPRFAMDSSISIVDVGDVSIG